MIGLNDRKSRIGLLKRLWIPIGAVLLAWLMSNTGLHIWLDYWLRDHQQQLTAEEHYFSDSLVLDIDDASLQRLEPYFGNWPYSREVYALILEYLSLQGAKSVVFDILFAEARANDERFGAAVGKYERAVFVAGAPSQPLPVTEHDRGRLKSLSWKEEGAIPAMALHSIVLPREEIAFTAGGDARIGVVTAASDADGVVRRLPLLYRVAGSLIPSLPLRATVTSVAKPEVAYDAASRELRVSRYSWPLDSLGTLQIYYPKNANSILTLSFADVAEAALGNTDVDAEGFFEGKTVFIGSTAYLSDRVNTPRGHMAGTYLLAIAHETMKQGLALRPDRTGWDLLLVAMALAPGLLVCFRDRYALRELLISPLIAAGVVIAVSMTLLAVSHQKNSLLLPLVVLLLGALFAVLHYQFVVKKQNRLLEEGNLELARVANSDPLTGLYNRRAFQDLYRKEVGRIGRYGGQLPSIAIMDLDHFKSVNDTYGHDIGDEVLKTFSSILVRACREADVCCRWGGEEFAVLLPETPLDRAAGLLERIRLAISEEKIPPPAEELVVTVSIGAAIVDSPEAAIEKTVKKADEALYRAKEGGRNRICVSE